jgi:hypothetical protein
MATALPLPESNPYTRAMVAVEFALDSLRAVCRKCESSGDSYVRDCTECDIGRLGSALESLPTRRRQEEERLCRECRERDPLNDPPCKHQWEPPYPGWCAWSLLGVADSRATIGGA